MSDPLDEFIHSLQETKLPLTDASAFFLGMRKFAASEDATEEAAEFAEDVSTGEEPTVADGEVMYATNTPDETSHFEGEFAVPTEQVVASLVNLASHKLKAQAAYLFYGETLRGLSREGLQEFFADRAEGDAKDVKYFSRRVSMLVPGGAQIPVPPMPTPLQGAQEILNQLITIEQQGIILLKHLRAMVGGNPMKFTVEEMLSEEQDHVDQLWQYMPEEASTRGDKLANAAKIARHKLSASVNDAPPPPGPNTVVVPAPGTEPVEQYMAREQGLALQQAQAEAAHHAQRAAQLEEAVVANQAQAQQATAAAQQAAAQAQETGMQLQQAQAETMQAQQVAQQEAEQAAAQAEGKMRLAIRVQQFRQQLADIASQNPVEEEGLAMGAEAGPGAPLTAAQQQQQAAEEQQMAAQQQGAAITDPNAAKEQAQANRAEQEAVQQQEQANAAASGQA